MAVITDYEHFESWNFDSLIVVTAASVAIFNACELLLLTASRFKEWRSVYFISLLVAPLGIFPYFVGLICEFFELFVFWACMLLSTTGWVCLVTGQAVVLYSRLGLILDNQRILNAVKWMITIDAVAFHTSTTFVQFGKSYGPRHEGFLRAFFHIEKLQMTGGFSRAPHTDTKCFTGFCIQEFIISGL